MLGLASACAGGEPTEFLARPDGSPVGVSVPVEYERSPADVPGVNGVELTRPGGVAGQTRPYGRVLHRRVEPEVAESIARRDLRLITDREVDPLVVSQSEPGTMRVLDYVEIDDDEWWGARMKLVMMTAGSGEVVVDRLVLVGRADRDLVEVQFTCSATCFTTYAEEIDEIVGSWTTESDQ